MKEILTEKDILTEIVSQKRIELIKSKEQHPVATLKEACAAQTLEYPVAQGKRSMRQSLASSPSGIIAEFKRRSPSKGWINQTAQADIIPPAYQEAGASALSILTDEPYFGGTMQDIEKARPLVQQPILRKEFIIDPYQLYEAKLLKADAVLLIASILSPAQCQELAEEAHLLGLEVLLEIHHEAELTHLNRHIDMLGVNNRHLGTFHTDVNHSFELAKVLPKELLWVSESGIAQPQTVAALREIGFRGFLMGENFMKRANPGEALKSFIEELTAIEALNNQ